MTTYKCTIVYCWLEENEDDGNNKLWDELEIEVVTSFDRKYVSMESERSYVNGKAIDEALEPLKNHKLEWIFLAHVESDEFPAPESGSGGYGTPGYSQAAGYRD